MFLREKRYLTLRYLGVALFLVGCGYHFKGAGLTAPEGVKSIAIPVLENRTAESGIETTFTGDLIYEFTRSKILEVVDEPEADAVLKGRVHSVDEETVSHTATYDSGVQRVTVKLDLQMKRTDGRILWAVQGMSDDEPFQISDDKRVTEENKRQAIGRISERIAEKVHNRIFEDF